MFNDLNNHVYFKQESIYLLPFFAHINGRFLGTCGIYFLFSSPTYNLGARGPHLLTGGSYLISWGPHVLPGGPYLIFGGPHLISRVPHLISSTPTQYLWSPTKYLRAPT